MIVRLCGRTDLKDTDPPDSHLISLDAASLSPAPVPKENVRSKGRVSLIFPKQIRQKLQTLYAQAASLMDLFAIRGKQAINQFRKVENFGFRDFHTKVTAVTRKCTEKNAFAIFKFELWCLDKAYADELAKKCNGVKYLLNRQGLFDRTVNATRLKTKGGKAIV